MLIHTENTAPEVSSGATEHQAEGPFSCRALDQVGYFEGQAGIPAIRTAFEFRLLLIAPPPAGGRRSAGATDHRDFGRSRLGICGGAGPFASNSAAAAAWGCFLSIRALPQAT